MAIPTIKLKSGTFIGDIISHNIKCNSRRFLLQSLDGSRWNFDNDELIKQIIVPTPMNILNFVSFRWFLSGEYSSFIQLAIVFLSSRELLVPFLMRFMIGMGHNIMVFVRGLKGIWYSSTVST